MPHHKEIAVWAGTTPETVAKAIGSLLEAQVAKRRYKTLHILDRQRLQAMVIEMPSAEQPEPDGDPGGDPGGDLDEKP